MSSFEDLTSIQSYRVFC